MNEQQIGPLYCDILAELKTRISTVSEVLAIVQPPRTEWEARHGCFLLEGLYLQMRKVCELLSRGMLVVQSANPEFQSRSLTKAYRADKLIKAMTQANPRSFPTPVSNGEWVSGSIEFISEYAPVFTAEELQSLYYKCEEILHIGTLKDLQSGQTQELNQDFLKEWNQRLIDGLNHHIVSLPSTDRVMLVNMGNSTSSTVTCTFATAQNDR